VGVGVGVGSFLAIMLAVFLFLRHRRNNRNIPKAGATELDGLEGSRAISESEAATKYTYNKSNSELEGDSTARIPKNPQELDPVPIYEIGSSTQPAEGEKNTGKNEDESSGQYFKQDGTYRHEAP
jgi:hypothetical protein